MKHSKSTTKGYAKASGKKRTNLSLNARLVELAQAHLPATVYGSLSSFVERKLMSEFRRIAPKLRAAGHSIPEEVFTK